MNFLTLLFIGALFVTGVWVCFLPNMVLGELGDMAERIFPSALCKPLFTCPACMSSAWGTPFWFYMGGSVNQWPVFVLSLCGAMHLISVHILQKNAR